MFSLIFRDLRSFFYRSSDILETGKTGMDFPYFRISGLGTRDFGTCILVDSFLLGSVLILTIKSGERV